MVRFQVLKAANMKITVFWDVSVCCLVDVYRRLGGVHCLHHQIPVMCCAGLHNVKNSKSLNMNHVYAYMSKV
jgi:hypothetical protein